MTPERERDSDIDRKLKIFMTILASCIIRHTPVTTIEVNSSSPTWFDKDLVKLARKKNDLHSKMTDTRLKS